MKSVVFVVPSLSNGGAERVVANVSSELSKKYKVIILCFYKTEKSYSVNSNVEVRYLFEKKTNIIKKIATIRKQIKQIKPDLIIPFLNYVCTYTTFSCLFTRYRKKVCCTLRVNPKYSTNLFTYKISVRLSGRYIVQNQGEKDYFGKSIRKKTTIIPNPISDEVQFIEKQYNSKLKEICCVGRLEDQKNYEQMLRVFAKLDKEYSLYIYGKGSSENKLISLSKDLGISDRVNFCGYSSDVLQKIAKHDLYVMTSNFEGMPNSLMEAMGVGLPVISSNCDYGPSDLINNDKDGLLYNLKDDEELLSKINYIANNYEHAIEMGKNAREKILSEYNASNVFKMWEAFIEGKEC